MNPLPLTIPISGRNPTAHERRVMELLAHGHTAAEIGAMNGTTAHAVHRTLEYLRNEYAPTTPSLMAAAITLQWFQLHIQLVPGRSAARVCRIHNEVSRKIAQNRLY